MKLRESLLPNVTQERIDFIKSKILEIELDLESENVNDLIAEFAKETGKNQFDFAYFRDFHSFESVEEFAIKAAAPKAEKINDIKKGELIWIVERIIEADENANYFMEVLEKNVTDPEVSDLIYWPSERGYERELSAEEIVEIALNYKR